MTQRFRDRAEAGKRLAKRLMQYKQHDDVIVLGLPRGGVIPACEVARELNVPMDILMVRKLVLANGLAIGAITSGGHRLLNQQLLEQQQIPEAQIEASEAEARHWLQTRERLYRGHTPDPTLAGHSVILVDDGMCSGATMQVALAALAGQDPRRLIVAVPVASQQAVDAMGHADELVCLQVLPELERVADGYQHFPVVEDQEVCDRLAAIKRLQYQDFDIPPFV